MSTNALWTALLRAGYDLIVLGRVEHEYLRGEVLVMRRGAAAPYDQEKRVGAFSFSGDRVSSLSGTEVQRVATAVMTAAAS
jgi:ABC-type cobalamin/Fe3+-siderophores transport system ATPase subunit